MFYIVYCIIALDAFSVGTYLAIQQKHVLLLGGNFFTVSLLKSVVALLAVFWKPIVVVHLNNGKNQQDVIVWCLLISMVGNVLSSTTSSVVLYFISRLTCVASIPVQTVLKSTVTQSCTNKDESFRILKKLGSIGTVGFIIGRVVGGHSGDYIRGIDFVYTSMIANILISIVLVKSLPGVSSEIPKRTKKDVNVSEEASNVKVLGKAFREVSDLFMDLKQMLVSSRYREVFAMKLFVEYVYVINFNTLGTMLATEYQMPMPNIGYVMVFNMILHLVTSSFVNTIISKYYGKDSDGYCRLRHFTSVQVVSYITISLTSHLAAFLIGMMANSCSKPFIDSALDDLLRSKTDNGGSQDSPKSPMPVVEASFNNIVSVSQIFGPVTAGLTSCSFNARSSFVVCALSMIIANQLSQS